MSGKISASEADPPFQFAEIPAACHGHRHTASGTPPGPRGSTRRTLRESHCSNASTVASLQQLRGLSPVAERDDPAPYSRRRTATSRGRVTGVRLRAASSRNLVVFLSGRGTFSALQSRDPLRQPSRRLRPRTLLSARCVYSVVKERPHKTESSGCVVETPLKKYWKEKRVIEEKYEGLLGRLKIEELSEVKHRVEKCAQTGKSVQPEAILGEIAQVREYYEGVRGLFLSQRLVEQEEILGLLRQRVVGDS